MGWTCLYDKPNNVKEYLNSLHTHNTYTHDYTVLDSAIVSFRTYYAAVKSVCKVTGEVKVFASIVKMTFNKYGEKFCYKEMHEDCGAHEVKCPMRILNLLTATDAKYAVQWREACIAYHKKHTSGNALKNGDIVKFKHPLKFTNGAAFTEMRAIKENSKTRFTPVDNPYSFYHIDKTTLASYMA